MWFIVVIFVLAVCIWLFLKKPSNQSCENNFESQEWIPGQNKGVSSNGKTKKNEVKIGDINFAILPSQFVVFDLETTGLNCEADEIIEIGAIKVDKENLIINKSTDELKAKSFQVLIKPAKRIPKKITEITNITQKMIDDSGESLGEAISQFLEFIGDVPLVTFNSNFDMPFLKKAVKKVNSDMKLKNKVSCALKMARRAWPGLNSYKLSSLSTLMGLDTSDSHRALGDTKRALAVYLHAATKLNQAN